MRKRGQVSAFIIIGIVLLLSIVIVILIRNQVGIFSPGGIEVQEIKPIYEYLESCIESAASDGALLLSTQGGYISPFDIYPEMEYEPDSYIDNGFKVPMWYYEGNDRMPEYEFLELQLSEFVEENVRECINNFEIFKQEYDITILGEMTATAVINDYDIDVNLDYPLEIRNKIDDKVTNLEDFSFEIDSSLGKLFSLAAGIMRFENDAQVLEILTDDMIATSNWLPYEGVEFKCGKKTWNIDEVEEYIKTLISANIQFLAFEGTDYTSSGFKYYDNNYLFDIGAEDHSTIRVNTIYDPAWDLELDVRPRNGKKIRPLETTLAYLTIGCVKLYHHKYDVKYPVLFQVIDTENPSEQFFFATPVIVKNNMPNRDGSVVIWPPDVNIIDSEEYCSKTVEVTDYVVDELTGQIIPYQGELYEKDFYPLRVIAVDEYYQGSRPALEGVTIGYQCVGYLCDEVGVTALPLNEQGLWTGEPAMVKEEFPPCTNGHVIASKEGYIDGLAQQTSSAENANEQVTVSMVQKRPKRFSLMVETDSNGVRQTRNLLEYEDALVSVKSDRAADTQYLFFKGSEEVEDQELYLLVGDYYYELDIKLLSNDALVGGAFLNWTPSVSDVENKEEVVFYAERKIVVAPPQNAEEYQELWDFAVENSREPQLI